MPENVTVSESSKDGNPVGVDHYLRCYLKNPIIWMLILTKSILFTVTGMFRFERLSNVEQGVDYYNQ